MCGISGYNAADRLVWIKSAVGHQKMRGPDNSNWVSSSNGWCFGHNRLSIIDLTENSNQPLYHDDVDQFVYNGEWYDYKKYHPHHEGDTRAVYSHIRGNGFKKALNDINGMFAIAYYDDIRGKLYLAVDRFGQKPLYYYYEGRDFYFASTPAALYAIKDKWELDMDALQSYWLLGSVMGSDGLMKGIKKLCASEMLTYDGSTVKVERYWEPKFIDCSVKDLEDMVLESIRKVKVSDVPIHIFLSGGIDSTLVASQFEGGNAIHLNGPEAKYAQQVAEKFNIDLRVIDPEDTETEEALTDYVFKSGEPTMAGIIPWIVARETAKYGKVAISANGADELFFGYDRTSDEIRMKQLSHIFRTSAFKINERIYDGSGRKLELDTYVQFDLNKTLDFASMCHGLEVRNPFLDHELVEMALSIPEKIHRQNGNKTILKNMLRKMGFKEPFLSRPKQGFSLFKQPKNLDNCLNLAWDWVQKEGFLDLKGKVLNGRDKQYLRMSALGFYYWHHTWKHKLR